MDRIGGFHEGLTRLERLWRLAIHLQDDGTLQNINEPRRRMRVAIGRRTRRDVADPNMHVFVAEISQTCHKKIGALDGRLLGVADLGADQAESYPAIKAGKREDEVSFTVASCGSLGRLPDVRDCAPGRDRTVPEAKNQLISAFGPNIRERPKVYRMRSDFC